MTLPETQPEIQPLTPAQDLFRLGQMLAGDAPIYNMAWRFDLHGALDPVRFSQALRDVAGQHDAPRLRLVQRGGAWGQQIGPLPALPAPLDLRGAPDPDHAATKAMNALVAQHFDLQTATWRSRLLRVADRHWIWLLCQHHILADATTGQALFAAVSEAYQGRTPPPATQFRDFARRAAADPARQAHWQGIAGAAFDRQGPFGASGPGPSAQSRTVDLDFGAARSAALDALAADPDYRMLSPHLTRFAILITIHAAWSHRLTGNRRLCIGAPVHLRTRPGDRAALGLFVETFPFCLTVDPGETFLTLFHKARLEAQTWLRHAGPGGSGPEAAASYTSLFNYLPVQFGAFAGIETTARFYPSGAHDPGHDHQLTLSRYAGPDTPLALQFRLKTALYPGVLGDQAAQYWARLADAMFADPGTALETVPLGGAVISGGAMTPAPTVLECFDQHVARAPDALAICDAQRSLSYRAFAARVEAYAQGCREAGIAPGDIVLIYAERSIETVAAIWGVVRAGAVFAPFVASTPVQRVQSVIARHNIAAALDTAQARALTLAQRVRPAEIPAHKTPRPDMPAVRRDSPAYLLFTSGSSGAPKGVMVTHGALADYIAWNHAEFPGDHALATSLAFDTALTPLFAPLTSGCAVRVYPETGTPDLAIRQVIEDDLVDVANLTPSQYPIAFHGDIRVRRLSKLKFTGEALPAKLARDATGRAPAGLAVGNEYGPTECVVGSSLHWFDSAMDTAPTVTIGRPGPGVDMAIMDPHGTPLPPGLAGEIWIGGRLSAGYLDRDDLTRAQFVLHDGQRMYRTGDLARIDHTGRLHYLGRADDQLKVSGVRVDPQEVGAALRALHGIRHVHVGAWPAGAQSGDLSAWVVGTGDPGQWRAALLGTLPREMVPTRIALVPDLPLLASGKIDRNALPEPPRVHIPDAAYSAPQPGLETTLASLVARELGQERVGRCDNFHAIGLDSLAAIRVALAAGKAGLDFDVAQIFAHPSIAELAQALSAAGFSGGPRSTETEAVPDTEDAAPLIALDDAQIAAIGRMLNGD